VLDAALRKPDEDARVPAPAGRDRLEPAQRKAPGGFEPPKE
jgi:hypothetical protein